MNEINEELKKILLFESQQKNINIVSKILDNNLMNIEAAKNAREVKKETLNKTLSAVTELKFKLENEIQSNENQVELLGDIRGKCVELSNKFIEVGNMDYTIIKLIYQEATKMSKLINREVDFLEMERLEEAISLSTVKINFDKADEYLAKIKAENDQIYIKLTCNFEDESELIYLSTFMIKSLFKENIVTHNTSFRSISVDKGNQPAYEQFEDLSKFISVNEGKSHK